jgi:SAM-dependent methyltransferase
VVIAAMATELRSEERLARLFRHLGIRRAHLATGFAAQAVTLASVYPELVGSLTLVCPTGFVAESLRPFGRRLLCFHGDHGANAPNMPRAQEALTEATVVTLRDYADTAWSDPVADRHAEIGPAMLAFIAEMSREDSIAPALLLEGDGEHAGINYHVQGSGPPLVLLPLNLARSQWDQLVPRLAEQYCTITLGGAFLGIVPILEERMRGGYGAVVRALVDAADLQPRETVLEVGCGSGAVARWLARYTAGSSPITAVDVNGYILRVALSLAKSEGQADRITFQEANAESLPFPTNGFDVTLSFTVMEEVDADRMLAEMVRVTKPGGRVGVVVRAADRPLWVNLPVRAELLVKIEAAPGAGASEHGCADASLYRRFTKTGLTDLKMGPQLGPNQPAHGLDRFTNRVLEALPADEVEEFRTAVTRSVADGTMLWADLYHCAVGTKA